MDRPLRLLAASLVALLAVCAWAGVAVAAQGGVLSRNGRVGDVYVGRSTVAHVRSAIGRPTSSARRATNASEVRYLELRYDCGRGKRSLFYFDRRGRLANFVTNCASWRTVAGTEIGDDYYGASEREQSTPEGTCGDGLVISKAGRARLYIGFAEEGAPVEGLAVEGRNGVLGC